MSQEERQLLREDEAAQFCDVSPRSLQRWRWAGNGPRFIRLGGTRRGAVRYRRSDLERYLEERTINTTSEELASS